MNISVDLECVFRGNDQLGEVPIWCEETERLWWVDVKSPAIQFFEPASGQFQRYPLAGRTVGSWAFRSGGEMVLAMQDGLYRYSPASSAYERLVAIEEDMPLHRLNDGKWDRKGRFWVGSMHESYRVEPRGSFYCIDANLQVKKVFDQFTVPNSVAFSPDDRRMYFADTPTKTISVFDFDLQDGVLSNRRIFCDISGSEGAPDGSTVDVDGCLWNAEFRAGRVVRYSPRGEVDRIIRLPVSQPTSCVFGGKELDILYITTAAQNLSAEQLEDQPLAGAVFAIRPGTQGLPEPRFGA